MLFSFKLKNLFLALISATFFISFSANAGRMKDLFYMHSAAVNLHLWGSEENEMAPLQNTRIVKAKPGQFIAVSSDIQVYNPRSNQWEVTTCTTQFSGTGSEDLKLTEIQCVP